MSMSSTDKGLLTPGNCAVIFIDHQPQMFFGAADADWEDLLKNVLVLARGGEDFRRAGDSHRTRIQGVRRRHRAAIARSVSRPATHPTFQHERVGRPGVRGRGQEHRAQELSPGGAVERGVSGVPGLADVGGRVWRLCRQGCVAWHEPRRPGDGAPARRAGRRGLGDGAAGVTRIPTRLGPGGALRRGNGHREGALLRSRPRPPNALP